MSQAAILVWVSVTTGSAAAHVGPRPTPEARARTTFDYTTDYTTAATPGQRAAISTWAQSHLLTVEAPKHEARGTIAGYDPKLVRQIEDLLEQARVSADSMDESLALEQLQNAETLIYAHPELPQAGFLLAEAAAQQASIVEHTGQARLAQIQRQRAAILEGARVRPYAAAAEVHGATAEATSAPEAGLRDVTLLGLSAGDELDWNGSPLGVRRLTLPTGEHHVQVRREGELIWAGFLVVHGSQTELRVPVAPPTPCTSADLSGVRVHQDRVLDSERVRCPLWAIARPAANPAAQKGIDIALCRYSSCEVLLNWQAGFGQPLLRPLHEAHPWRLPPWATYVAAGVGAALASGIVLWQTGAFDDPAQEPKSFTFGGIE